MAFILWSNRWYIGNFSKTIPRHIYLHAISLNVFRINFDWQKYTDNDGMYQRGIWSVLFWWYHLQYTDLHYLPLTDFQHTVAVNSPQKYYPVYNRQNSESDSHKSFCSVFCAFSGFQWTCTSKNSWDIRRDGLGNAWNDPSSQCAYVSHDFPKRQCFWFRNDMIRSLWTISEGQEYLKFNKVGHKDIGGLKNVGFSQKSFIRNFFSCSQKFIAILKNLLWPENLKNIVLISSHYLPPPLSFN